MEKFKDFSRKVFFKANLEFFCQMDFFGREFFKPISKICLKKHDNNIVSFFVTNKKSENGQRMDFPNSGAGFRATNRVFGPFRDTIFCVIATNLARSL